MGRTGCLAVAEPSRPRLIKTPTIPAILRSRRNEMSCCAPGAGRSVAPGQEGGSLKSRSINPLEPALQPTPPVSVGLPPPHANSQTRAAPLGSPVRFELSSILKRIPPLWWLRNRLRGSFCASLRHIARIRESREIFAELLRSQNAASPPPELCSSRQIAAPYPELRRFCRADRPCRRTDVIFVTGRFRSGSTLVWNLFRHLP